MRTPEKVNIEEHWEETFSKEEIESIERGLKDLEEGKVYLHETARKIYEKYL
jgi:predicted transcriptional regulator